MILPTNKEKYKIFIVIVAGFVWFILTKTSLWDFIPKNLLIAVSIVVFIITMYMFYQLIQVQQKELKLITRDYLYQLKAKSKPDDYHNFLKRMAGSIEATIIANKERGKKNNYQLEEKLKILKDELNNIK